MKTFSVLLTATIALPLAFPLFAMQREEFDPLETQISIPTTALTDTTIASAGSNCGDELFNNGPFVTSTGNGPDGSDVSLLQNQSLTLSTFGLQANPGDDGPHFRMADDFTLTKDSQLRCLVVYAYQTNSTTASSMTAVNIRLWDGPPDAVGSSVVFGNSTTNRMLDTGWTEAYRFAETAIDNTQRPLMWLLVNLGDTALSPGTYWIDWQASGSLPTGPWAPPITVIGETTTGDALQLNSTGWETYTDLATGEPQGIPFLVFGDLIPLFADRFED